MAPDGLRPPVEGTSASPAAKDVPREASGGGPPDGAGAPVEVTEAETARRQLTLLAEVSRLLATSLDLEATLSGIARLVVPALADWCVIDIPIDMLEEDGSLRRRTFHADPAKIALAHELQEGYRPKPGHPPPT